MALKLNERYPSRFNNPSDGYPQGSFKNRTTPTSKDGSYLEQDWANDKEGFFQSLLSAAVVQANGSVDRVGSSQYFDAMKSIIASAGVSFSNITGKPTTLSGYGITDGMLKNTGGIGSTLNTPTASDTNAALAGGLWSLAGTASAPFANGMLLRGNYNGALSWTQIATSIDNAGMFWQGSINGTINPWRQVWDSVSFNPASKINATNVANAGFANSTTDTPFMTHSNGTTVALSKKNTAQLATSGWSKNTDTGEIIQWVEYLIGDIPSNPTKAVAWPISFPTACLNVICGFKQSSTSFRANATANYIGATTSGCTVKLDNWASGQDPQLTLVVQARGN
jgi:hypothetical protein